MTPLLKKRSNQYFIIGILLSLLLHIWLLIAFIKAKIPKPKHNKPIQITMVQKGIPNPSVIPPSIPLPPQIHPKPKPKAIPKVNQRFQEKSNEKPYHKVQKYEALPSNILKSLPKSSYKPKIGTKTVPNIPNQKESAPSSSNENNITRSQNIPSKEGEEHPNAKANLNLNIKQFVKKEESIYQYLSWLIRYLNKQARERDLYPKEAKKLGIKGEVVVRVTINKDGTIDRSSLKVVQSSGYKILDESAPKIIYELSPFRKPPKKITINLPVYFLINGYY